MSPVIILGLVLMWAVVLVPMWLRRHDEAEESRSVDRFSTAMRTLSRRAVPAEGRYVVMPHRTRAVDVHVSGAAAAEPETAQRTVRSRGGSRRVSAAARRRRSLIGLLLVTVLALVAAVVLGGVALWTLQLLMDVALVGFVWRLRAQARVRAGMPASPRVLRTAAVSRQRRRAAVASPAASVPPIASTAIPDALVPDETATEPEVAPPAAVDEPVEEPAVEQVAGAGGEAWEPVPVPRPTYTMKPPAPARRRRAAPLAEPAADPAAATAPEPAAAAAAASGDGDEVSALDEILTHRWAVND